MTTATRITEAEALGYSSTPAVETTARYRDTGGTLVNPIGPGTLDGPRIRAREAHYGNRQAEVKAVMDIDQAAFDRVRALEQYMIGRAENFIEDMNGSRKGIGPKRPGLIDTAEDIVTNLNDLVTELERGATASALAERFVALQNDAMHAALPKLLRAMNEAEGHLPRMQDPYSATQDIVAKMPHSSFRPIVPARRH